MLLIKEKVTSLGNSTVIKLDKKYKGKELFIMDEETLNIIKK